MARYDAVFFDSGGTLFDPTAKDPSMREVIARRIDYLAAGLRAFGVSTDRGRLKRMHDKLHIELSAKLGASFSYYRLVLALVEQLDPGLSPEETAVVTVAYAGPRYRHWLYPGTARMLAGMAEADVYLGLIANTSWPGFAMATALAGVGIGRYFQTMVISCDEGLVKPDAEIFRRAQRRAGLTDRRMRILYVGDSIEADNRGRHPRGQERRLAYSPAAFVCQEFQRPGRLRVRRQRQAGRVRAEVLGDLGTADGTDYLSEGVDGTAPSSANSRRMPSCSGSSS